MRKKHLLVLLLMILSLPLYSQQNHDPTVVKFVNKGKMCVAPSVLHPNRASLHIPDGILLKDSCSIFQKGITSLGGNFYQNSLHTVFTLSSDSNFTISTGTVRFYRQSAPGKQRTITTNLTDYDRARQYIAFPNIEINTPDTISLRPDMGMDVLNISRGSAGSAGCLYLESDDLGSNRIYDVSLRSLGTAAAGAVVIEKHVKPFRLHSSGGNTYLYPFATPYTNQRAGYFAGNWVRAPQPNSEGSYIHPYATKSSGGAGMIDADQYLVGVHDLFTSAAPYLIRLQPHGHDYHGNDTHYIHTHGENHDLETFTFNGQPFSIGYIAEEKFSGNLIHRQAPDSPNTIQWAIGNSYTSDLSIDSLRNLIERSNIQFSSNIYLFPHGATAYSGYDLSDPDIPDIPAMSVFILLVSKNNTNTDDFFTITPRMQVHSAALTAPTGHQPTPAPPRRMQSPVADYANRLVFRLTPDDNPFIYDYANVVLRAGALAEQDGGDFAKSINSSNQYFQIYSQTPKGTRLQNNALPLNTESTSLCVTPPEFALHCRLTVSGAESLSTDDFLLYDTKNNAWTNLRNEAEYRFLSEPGDSPERFILYFQSPTGIDPAEKGQALYGYYQDNHFYLNRLTEDYVGSHLKLFNAGGSLVKDAIIDSYPQYRITAPGAQGVYIAKIEGHGSTVIKFIKR